MAGILASYARDAHLRIDQADLPALTSLRQALEDALGLRFEGEKGEHLFRLTLIQTFFYGVFSAWVLWARRLDAKPSEKTGFANALRETAALYAVAGDFDWRVAPYLLRVPMIRALYVTEMVRRLAALIALQSCLDDNYRNVIRTTYPWTNP